MNVIYTVLLALPIGLLVRPRATAVLTYLVVGSWVFAFQTVTVLLSWLGHDGRSAFAAVPDRAAGSFRLLEASVWCCRRL